MASGSGEVGRARVSPAPTRRSALEEGDELGYFESLPEGATSKYTYDWRTLLFQDATVQEAYMRYAFRRNWFKHSLALMIVLSQTAGMFVTSRDVLVNSAGDDFFSFFFTFCAVAVVFAALLVCVVTFTRFYDSHSNVGVYTIPCLLWTCFLLYAVLEAFARPRTYSSSKVTGSNWPRWSYGREVSAQYRTYHHDIYVAYAKEVQLALAGATGEHATSPFLTNVSNATIANITRALVAHAETSPFFRNALGTRFAFQALRNFESVLLFFIMLTPGIPFAVGAPFTFAIVFAASAGVWDVFASAVGFSFSGGYQFSAIIFTTLAMTIMYQTKRSELEVWAQVYASAAEIENQVTEITELQEKNQEMAKRNEEVQNQLKQVKLSVQQTELVKLSKEAFVEKLRDLYVNVYQEVTFLERLGEGSFGQCFSGIYLEEPVAIKVMRNSMITADGLKAFKREVHMLNSAQHPNIVRLKGFCMSDQLAILMEYMDDGSLLDMITKREPIQVEFKLDIFRDIMRALAYLKHRCIIHRDIKSENILLSRLSGVDTRRKLSVGVREAMQPRTSVSGKRSSSWESVVIAKLADLGESRFTDTGQTMTMTGTHGYTAPEIIRGNRYGAPIDVYSAACVMCEVLTWKKNYNEYGARPPWNSLNHEIAKGLRPTLTVGQSSAEDSGSSSEDVDEEESSNDQRGMEWIQAFDLFYHRMQMKLRNLIARMWIDDPKLRPEPVEVLFELEALIEEQSARSRKDCLNVKVGLLRKDIAKGFHELIRSFCCGEKQTEEIKNSTADLFTSTCRGSFEDEHMQKAFESFQGHEFVERFLLLLVGSSDQKEVKHTFEFPPFLLNHDFIETDKAFMVRVVYTVYTKEVASAPTIEILNMDKMELDDDGAFRLRQTKSFDDARRSRQETSPTAPSSDGGAPRPASSSHSLGKPLKLKRKLKKKVARLKPNKRGKGIEWKFVKAARYARKHALKVSETSLLLKLHALFMQGTQGDCPDASSAPASASELHDPLEGQKRIAWAKTKGKKRKNAMEEYIAEIDALFPGWNRFSIASMSGDSSEQGVKSQIVWSFRLEADPETGKIESIHVLRNDTEGAQTVDWFKSMGMVDEKDSDGLMGGGGGGQDGDPTKADLPTKGSALPGVAKTFNPDIYARGETPWIKDAEKHLDLDSQTRWYMETADKVANAVNWVYHERLRCYVRTEDWSDVRSLMHSAVIGARPAEVAEFVWESVNTTNSQVYESIFDKSAGKLVQEKLRSSGSSKSAILAIFHCENGARYTLWYRRVPAPWPLSDRDMLFHTCERIEKQGTKEELYWSVANSVEVTELPPFSGVLRLNDIFAVYYCPVLDDSASSRLSYSINMDFGGFIPTNVVEFMLKTMVKFPESVKKGMAEARKQRQTPLEEVDTLKARVRELEGQLNAKSMLLQ